MNQTQHQIQVKHDMPIEVKLEQVQRLLEQMGIRNVEPIAATSAQVKRMCMEVEKRRSAEGYVRKMEEVMGFAGASPYVVFAFQTQQGIVCIPDSNFVVDASGVYYVHKIDCRNDSLKCAQAADKVVDLLGIRKLVSSATFLAIHPSEQELCEAGILPPTACRPKEKEEKEEKTEEEEEEKEEKEEKKTSATQEEPEPLESVVLKKLTEELMQVQRRAAPEEPKDPKAVLKELGLGWLAELSEADVTALRSVAEDKTLLDALKDKEKRNAMRKFIESGFVPPAATPNFMVKWPQKDVELFTKLAEGTRSLNELVMRYLEAEFGCDVFVIYDIMQDLIKQFGGCEQLQKMRRRLAI